MSEQLVSRESFKKIIEKIKNLFQKEKVVKQFFEQKKQKYNDLKVLILPQEVWLAFFLPNDLEILEKYQSELGKITNLKVINLKKKALEILKDHKNFKIISHIKDPFDPISETVILSLLEIIISLKRNMIPKKIVRSLHVYWLTIAENFGLWRLRYILEDLVFSIIDEKNYKLITSLLAREKRAHEQIFKEIIPIVEYSLKKANLNNFQVIYRKKNTYGIYRKMQIKGKNINHITDLFAIRIIVNTEQDCYKALDVLHNLWRPYKDKFKDYIKNPKENEYQSIHTTLNCLNKKTVEFQIRSKKMDYIANFGPASHKLYKSFN